MKYALGLLGLAILPMTAMAADDDEPPRLWEGEANLSYIDRAGNTNSTNADFRGQAIRNGIDWRNTYKLEASNEYAEEERTAEKYFASGKADYKIDDKSYLFALLEYTNDNFSGFEYESSAVFGYGRDFLRTEKHDLSADAGLGYRRSELEDTGDIEEEAVLRLGLVYEWRINENTTFDEEFSTEIGEERTVTKSFTRLKVKINSSLFATLAYEIEHNTEVPPDTKNSDRKTLVGLNYTF